MNNDQEKYAADKFNSEALLMAYNSLGLESFEQLSENESSTKGPRPLEGTMFTHEQAMDAYKEGTIDSHIDRSENEEQMIPRTSFDEDLQ